MAFITMAQYFYQFLVPVHDTVVNFVKTLNPAEHVQVIDSLRDAVSLLQRVGDACIYADRVVTCTEWNWVWRHLVTVQNYIHRTRSMNDCDTLLIVASMLRTALDLTVMIKVK